MDRGASPSNSKMAKPAASISSNIIERSKHRSHAAKRNKNRCPYSSRLRCFAMTLFRPPVGPRRKSPGLLGISRQHLYDIPAGKKASVSSHRGSARQAFWRWRGYLGRGCRRPTILGTRSGPKTSVTSRPSRRRPLKTRPSGVAYEHPLNFQGIGARPWFRTKENRATRRACD